MTLLLFHSLADNERGPSYLEGLIAGWVAMPGTLGLSLGLVSRSGRVGFALRVSAERQRVIAFPGSSVEVLPESDWLANPFGK